MGTNAIPFLTAQAERRAFGWCNYYFGFYPRIPTILRNVLPEPGLPGAEIRHAALQALRMLDVADKQVYRVALAALKDKDFTILQDATEMLARQSMLDPELSAMLSAALLKPGLGSSNAIDLIQQYHLRGTIAIEALERALQDNDIQVRGKAVLELTDIGPKAERVIPVLLKGLQDPDTYVRCRTCEALEAIRGIPREVIPALTASLGCSDELVRAKAAEALGAYGAEAKPALPNLLQLAQDADRFESYYARKALKRIDPETASKAWR
jgi:HEAT repeat protein